MNPAHLHLLLNHIPIIGTLIGTLVCLASFILKDRSVRKIALGIFVFSAAVAIPAYLTGEGAEEAVEHLPGINEGLISDHEDVALIFIWLIGALGFSSLIALIAGLFKSPYTVKTAFAISLALSLIVLVTAYRLGNSGGEIRHIEIRTNVPPVLSEEQDDN